MLMDSDREHAANAEQSEFWNSASGQRWVTHQDALDRHLEPVIEALMELAGVRPGERVIDVGCGAGTTTLQLAAAVGAHGSVLGIDIRSRCSRRRAGMFGEPARPMSGSYVPTPRPTGSSAPATIAWYRASA
jgi:predicted O-methyltransferase YrrM